MISCFSDIDLAVQTPQIFEESFKTRSLFQIASMLKTALITRNGQVAVGARVPVLSFLTVVALGLFHRNAKHELRLIPLYP